MISQNSDCSNIGEINNGNQNIFKEVSVIQSKDRKIVHKKTNEKYCIIYFSALIFIYILFFINYLKTNNWYEKDTLCTGGSTPTNKCFYAKKRRRYLCI